MNKAATKTLQTVLLGALILMLSGMSGVVLAATPYGEALVEKGKVTVVREGKALRFKKSNTAITINEGDLIRVRRNSQILLKSREKATVTLGSNAVFHVKAWKAKEKTGFARLLFGRVRASITGLTGGERFNVKTATATIGVKGTEYRSAVTSRGDSMLITTESVVQYSGQSGREQDVGNKFMSVVVNGRAAISPVLTPGEIEASFPGGNLDSPPANSKAARRLPGEAALIEAGMVSKDDVEEGQQDKAPDNNFDVEDLDLNTNVENILENLNRAKVQVGFTP